MEIPNKFKTQGVTRLVHVSSVQSIGALLAVAPRPDHFFLKVLVAKDHFREPAFLHEPRQALLQWGPSARYVNRIFLPNPFGSRTRMRPETSQANGPRESN